MFIKKPITKQSISNRHLVYGVGVNDADYMVYYYDKDKSRATCPYYRKWTGMLYRCYCSKSKTWEHYKDITVCDEWHVFSVFKKWMQGQEWKGMDLDKDISVEGSKQYSPETCMFVPHYLNILFKKKQSNKDNDLPIGVTYDGKRKKYRATIQEDGKYRFLGRYETANEAEKAYNNSKKLLISRIAYRFILTPVVYHRLIRNLMFN